MTDTDEPKQQDGEKAAPQCVGRSGAHRRIRSEDLFQKAQEVIIEHEGEIYRLRITRNGKLILTK